MFDNYFFALVFWLALVFNCSWMKDKWNHRSYHRRWCAIARLPKETFEPLQAVMNWCDPEFGIPVAVLRGTCLWIGFHGAGYSLFEELMVDEQDELNSNSTMNMHEVELVSSNRPEIFNISCQWSCTNWRRILRNIKRGDSDSVYGYTFSTKVGNWHFISKKSMKGE